MGIQRKVQFTGKSTYIISIPKEWARSVGIKKGSKVYVDLMPDNTIRISPEPRSQEIKLTKLIDLRNEKSLEVAIREFIAAYVAGYDTFRVEYGREAAEAAKGLKDFISYRVANIAITEETEGGYTYKVIGAPRPMSVSDSIAWLKRPLFMMFQETTRAMRQGDAEILRTVMERDNVVDKAFLVIVRNLSSALMGTTSLDALGLSSYAEALHYYRAFRTMERIGDHIIIIADRVQRVLESGRSVDAEIAELMERSMNMFSSLCDSLSKVDVERAREISIELDDMRRISKSIYIKISDIHLHDIMLSLGRIIDYLLDLAETIFDISSVKSAIEKMREEANAEPGERR